MMDDFLVKNQDFLLKNWDFCCWKTDDKNRQLSTTDGLCKRCFHQVRVYAGFYTTFTLILC